MARIRTVKPAFWKHEELSELPEPAHMLAAALLNYADDEGYFNANPGLIKGECFPLRELSVSIPDCLTELSNIGWLDMFKGSDGKSYGHIVTFTDHQKINRPTDSKIKGLRAANEVPPTTHTQLTEPSPPEREEEGNKEREIGREGEARCAEPSPEDQAVDEWNLMAANLGLPEVRSLANGRKAKLAKCLKADEWRPALAKIRGSPFCQGSNDRGWKIDIDFVLTESKRTRLLEGKYDEADIPAVLDRRKESSTETSLRGLANA